MNLSIGAQVQQRLYVRRFYRIGVGALCTFFFLNNALSKIYVRVFEDTLLPLVADRTEKSSIMKHTQVFHTDSPFCNTEPHGIEMPQRNETVAIMLPSGACSPRKVAENVVKYYGAKSSAKVGYLLFYDGGSNLQAKPPAMTLFKVSDPSEVSGPTGSSLFQLVTLNRLDETTAKALMELKDKKATSLHVNITPDRLSSLPKASKILCMLISLASWIILIPMISFLVTRWLFRKSLTVEVGWTGIMLIYEGEDEDEVDQKKLFTKEKVLELPEVTFGSASGEDGSHSCGDVENPGFANTMCSICIEDFEAGERLRVLPCGHKFHTECISKLFYDREPLANYPPLHFT
jgi:hypothetical protein